MPSTNLLLEEPIRMASILEPSKSVSFFLQFDAILFIFFFVIFSGFSDLDLIDFVLLKTFFPAMTKIVGTLGPRSQSVEVISSLLKAGMSGNLFTFFSEFC